LSDGGGAAEGPARVGSWRRPAAELVWVAALGAAHTFAYIDGDLWPLQLMAVAALAWRVSQASLRHAAALGLAFGTAWLCAGTWWLFVSMHRYGGLPAPLAALAVVNVRPHSCMV